MFWALKSREKTSTGVPDIELWTSHWYVVAYNLLDLMLMLFVTNLTWNSFTSENSKKHALFKQGFVMLRSDL